MKTIAIVIGHGPSIDKGAFNSNGMSELQWNTGLANLIEREIGNRAKVIIVHRVTERIAPVKEVNQTKADLAIELHLNAFNSQASGTEMLHWVSSKKGALLAEKLQRAAVGVLGLPDRGLKPIKAGGRGAGFLRDTVMPAVIVESFFVDNGADLSVGTKKKDLLAKAYADALVA